jgi:hypothetical protein
MPCPYSPFNAQLVSLLCDIRRLHSSSYMISFTVHHGLFGFIAGVLVCGFTFAYSVVFMRLVCESILSLFMLREHFAAAKRRADGEPDLPGYGGGDDTDASPIVEDDIDDALDADDDGDEGGGHAVLPSGAGILGALTGGAASSGGGGYQAL